MAIICYCLLLVVQVVTVIKKEKCKRREIMGLINKNNLIGHTYMKPPENVESYKYYVENEYVLRYTGDLYFSMGKYIYA